MWKARSAARHRLVGSERAQLQQRVDDAVKAKQARYRMRGEVAPDGLADEPQWWPKEQRQWLKHATAGQTLITDAFVATRPKKWWVREAAGQGRRRRRHDTRRMVQTLITETPAVLDTGEEAGIEGPCDTAVAQTRLPEPQPDDGEEGPSNLAGWATVRETRPAKQRNFGAVTQRSAGRSTGNQPQMRSTPERPSGQPDIAVVW